MDPTFVKSDSLIGSVIGKPNTLPKDIDDITVDVHLFETAVGTQDMVKVDPIKIKEPLRLNIGTAATLGTVTSFKEQQNRNKIEETCLSDAKE